VQVWRATPLSRRRLLRQAGLAALAWTGGAVPSWSRYLPKTSLPSPPEDSAEIVPFTDIPENFSTKRSTEPEPNPGQFTFRLDLRNLKSWVTPTEEFFAVQHYNVPRLEASEWRLSVSGLQAKPLSLGLEELKRRPRIERTLTFECSGNRASVLHGMVGNARWAGASLKDLLQEAGPAAEAREVIFWAADSGTEKIRGAEYEQNFARSMSLDEALASDALIAYEMNGQPLPVVHGYPVRLVVPGWYGIANVKWLTGIEISQSRLMNRFMGRDYVTVMGRAVGDRLEWVESSVTRQRIKSVVARVSRRGARFEIFGAAWSEGTALARVEVQIDDGPWQPARLAPQDNPFAWTFWTLDTPALAPGEHRLASRATDARGRQQPASLELKKTYWEDNACFWRTISVT
jgi:DMSO/TMAO reductase YedYZ molybdopterin-dependent catalytic subunit